MYGGKFGGNFIPETLKKPIDDLTKLFQNLEMKKNFFKKEIITLKTILEYQHHL